MFEDDTTPDPELNSIDSELKTLREKLLELEKKKELKKKELELLKPIKVRVTAYNENGKYFVIYTSPYTGREEFNNKFKSETSSYPISRSYNDDDGMQWSLSIHNFPKFINFLDTYNGRLERSATKQAEAIISELKESWDYKVNFHPNKSEPYILIQHNVRVDALGEFMSIPGLSYKSLIRTYTVPKAEAWRAYQVLKKLRNVQYGEGLYNFLLDQLKKRLELETISSLESYPPYEALTFNNEKLKPFQAVGVRFGIIGGGRFIIGDEMGLGKTPQALAYAEIKKKEEYPDNPSKFRTVIIPPARLIPNWYRAIRKFVGKDARIRILKGNSPSSTDLKFLIEKNYDYVIISYNLVGKKHKIVGSETINEEGYKVTEEDDKENLWAKMINLAKFDLAIYDECHYMANKDSGQSQAGRSLETKYVVELSGTPIVNRPAELWPILHILNPNQFPDHGNFVRQYTYDGKRPKNVEELRELMKPLMIRRKHEDVQKDLKPIERVPHFVELEPKARKIYTKALLGLYTYMDSLGNEWESKIPNILVKLNRLKQICGYAKIGHTADLAWELYSQNEESAHRKVLIGSFWKDQTYAIHLRLKPNSISFVDKTPGGNYNTIDIMERYDRVDEFTKKQDIQFITTPFMSAQEGMDITAAGSVICNDMWWNPKVHQQFEGRAYGRIIDSHSINSYFVLAEDTIDEVLWNLVWDEKMGMIKEMLDGTEADPTQSVVKKLVEYLKENRGKM